MPAIRNVVAASLRAEVYVTSSPEAYRHRIIPTETGAKRIDRLPKRVSVVFKDEKTVREIAAKRFGAGSPSIQHYIDEHRERRKQFLSQLEGGMVCREIYNVNELAHYVRSRRHSATVELSEELISTTLTHWCAALAAHPSYIVGLTSDPLPFKYAIVDERTVVLHEVIGVNDLTRLNGIFITSSEAAAVFTADFETVWDRIPVHQRDSEYVLDWIQTNLVLSGDGDLLNGEL